MARTWWLRHGESTWNVAGREQGRTAHPPLTDRGRAQAREAAERLAGHGITRVLSSPLIRAQQTAEIVATRLGLGVDTEPDLIEKGFGESTSDVVHRVRDLLKRLPDDEPTLLVTHGDTLVIAVELLTGERIGLPGNCDVIGVEDHVLIHVE